MRLCICDDNPLHSQKILSIIEKYFCENSILETMIDIISPEKLLFILKEDVFPYDAVVLDIELGITDGIDCAKKINALNLHCQIIFITSFQKYMLDVYNASHTYFVPKNLMNIFLIKALEKVLKQYNSDTMAKQIVFHQKGKILTLKYSDITYFEQSGHNTMIYTVQGDTHKITYSLKDLKKILQDIPHFLQTHKSFIVNILHVKEFTRKEIIISDNKLVPISRTYYQKVKDVFLSYIADMNSM